MVSSEARGLVAYAFKGLSPNHAGNIRANCPLCETRAGKVDRKRSLSLQVRTGWYRCFRCAAVGRLDDVASEWDDREDVTETDTIVVHPPESFYELAREPGRSSHACKPHRDYLETRRRGLTQDVIRDVGIGGCIAGRYRSRVVVPVRSDGVWLWWVARSIEKSERKYMYPAGSRKGILFNHAALFVETDVPALLVEGCFDALPYWPDGVALLGSPTEDHTVALLAARRPICVALDGDAWLIGAGLTLRLKMEGIRAGALKLPPKTDPDELCVEETRYLAARSVC